MPPPNVHELIMKSVRIEVPVRAKRGLGTTYVKISKTEADELMIWHDLQHMSARNANEYISFTNTDGYIVIGQTPE